METKRLTHSSMTCAKTCLRKYYFRYILGVVRQREETPRRVGTLFHLGLELGRPPNRPDYPAWCVDDEDQYKMDCDWAIAAGMVDAYLKYWEDDAAETVHAELEFDVPVANPETGGVPRKFRAAGKIDKIIVADGRKMIMEHKTTSDSLELDGTYWRRLMMDQQISHYINGARSLGLGIENTVAYDVTRRPGQRAKSVPILDGDGMKIIEDENGERVMKKNGDPRQSGGEGMTLKARPETPNELRARIREAMLADPEQYFCRREIPRVEADLEEYAHELWQQQKLLTACHNAGYWFRNTSACVMFRSPCDYFEICYQGLAVENGVPEGYEFKRPHSELTEGGKK